MANCAPQDMPVEAVTREPPPPADCLALGKCRSSLQAHLSCPELYLTLDHKVSTPLSIGATRPKRWRVPARVKYCGDQPRPLVEDNRDFAAIDLCDDRPDREPEESRCC